MTYFANAGIAWPRVEHETRAGATSALKGCSVFFHFVSRSEEDVSHQDTYEAKESIEAMSRYFWDAAEKFEGAARMLGRTEERPFMRHLTPTDLFIAGVSEEKYGKIGVGNIVEMYFDLSSRLRLIGASCLALAARDTEPLGQKPPAKAAAVFRITRDLEEANIMARIIAVCNQKSI